MLHEGAQSDWTAHMVEQLEDHVIFRPESKFVES